MSRILITSALPYINGVKHLGNLIGSMLPADVFARYQRARGRETMFVCATDEHGTPAELAALEAGLPVAEYCRREHEVQADLARRWGLSFDVFGRSSSPQNRDLTLHFARTLWRGGFIEVRSTRQVYSNADRRFLPDRYVIGTCPHCGYDRARGDQCENCTRVLDPTDLIEPRSAVSGSPDIEIRDSKHLFLKQSGFSDDLRAWIDGKADTWSNVVISIARKWLDEGLRDRGITRDLSWGVPVEVADWGPNPAGETLDPADWAGKVFYVWYDAPIEYIGATREWADAKGEGDAWERWWKQPGAADVRYVEFMGKDNVPFHTVGFPVTIMGANRVENRAWKLVDDIKGFNWLTYYGGKFSTSQKRGVFMDQALEILPADYWRWYLIANAPESADSSFTWEHFAATVNKDLADVLGNFVNRVLKFAVSKFGGQIPDGGKPGPAENDLAARLERLVGQYTLHLEEMQFRKAAQELRAVWVAANEYVAVAAPWTVIKTDPAAAACAVRTAINLIRVIAVLSGPIVPETSAALLRAIGAEPQQTAWPLGKAVDELSQLKPGHPFEVPPVMFVKLAAGEVEALERRFGGDS